MSEQQSETGTTTATATTGDRWGNAITPARQAQLDGYFQRWDSLSAGEQAERGSPFAGVSLSGADVFSLAARTLAGPDGDQAAWDAAVAQLRAAQNDLGLQLMLHLADLHLEGAVLGEAHLEDAFLDAAHLERAKLVGASFDKTSRLNDAVLTGASFDQVTFDNTNLTVVDWSLVDCLGDERTARTRTDADGKSKDRGMRLAEFKAAVRANRVLAVTLQAQGLS